MTKATQGYPYPPDEFDLAGADLPRGAHRAPVPWIRRALPFLIVLVAFPVLAYVLVTLLSTSGGFTFEPGRGIVATTQSPSTPGGETSEDASASDGDPTDKDAGDEADEPSDEPTSEPTQEETEEPAPEVDLSAAVRVFNSTNTSGLAAKAAERLTTAGFAKVTPSNYDGALKRSTVFYANEDLVTTAELAAQTLGIDTVTLDAEAAGTAISVVLESDFTP